MIDYSEHDTPRISFHVANMSGQRSAGIITRVIIALDNDAAVRIDLPMRRVEIEPSCIGARAFRVAICNAGFTPVRQWQPGRGLAHAGP